MGTERDKARKGFFRKVWVYPLFLLLGLLAWVLRLPQGFETGVIIDLHLPSERAIPRPVLTASCQAKGSELRNDGEWRFRYALTGAEGGAGIPYWIFAVLPDMFPEQFRPLGYLGYERFGFGRSEEEVAEGPEADIPDPTTCGSRGLYYRGYPLPRGLVMGNTALRWRFLKSEIRFTRVSLNCSSCHRGGVIVGTKTRYISGMPNHSFSAWGFGRFLAGLAQNPAFNKANVIQAINARLQKEGHPPLNWLEEFLYGVFVKVIKSDPRQWEVQSGRTSAGAGRIDAFSVFKYTLLGLPDDGSVSPVRYLSLWNQRSRVRFWHHYDGNTQSKLVQGRADAFGVGAFPFTMRLEVVDAIADWMESLPSPAWPFPPPDAEMVKQGEALFREHCASCHGWLEVLRQNDVNIVKSVRVPGKGGQWVPFGPAGSPGPGNLYMTVIPLDTIGTDPNRYMALRANTPVEKECLAKGSSITPDELRKLGTARDLETGLPACRQDPSQKANEIGAKTGLWEKDAFHPATGYLAEPLDGIWARSPYLHNGSVPTVLDLLSAERPSQFVQGRTRYDEQRMGFDSGPLTEREKTDLDQNQEGGGISVFDTTRKGNGNAGHPYGVSLTEPQKKALIDYLKTL